MELRLKKTELRANEYPKNKEEIFLIDLINKETNKLMDDLGVQSFDIPERNFHIIPSKLCAKYFDNTSAGVASYDVQAIALNADDVRRHLIVFASVAFHEALHLKVKQVMQVRELDDDLKKDFYRTGITVYSPNTSNENKKFHSHFRGLHEAVIANEQKKFVKKLMEMEMFSDAKEWMQSGVVAEEKLEMWKKQKIFADDIYYTNKAENIFAKIGYRQQREVLLYVCNEIASDSGVSGEDVEKEFLKANFSGRLIPVAKLVEDSFGKGSFRELGNLGIDDNSAINTLEALKKFRLRKVKK